MLELKPDRPEPAPITDAAEPADASSDSGPATPSTAAPTFSAEQAIEALLLCADKPVPQSRLNELLQTIGFASAQPATTIESLNAAYQATGRAFRIEHVAGGYRIMTVAALAPAVLASQQHRSTNRLSRASIEALAVIAYRQPITRATLEAIRGVACGEVLKTLMDRDLVTVTGRAEELGRPMLYGTTRRFLDHFGLASLRDLPPPPKALDADQPPLARDADRSSASRSAEPAQ